MINRKKRLKSLYNEAFSLWIMLYEYEGRKLEDIEITCDQSWRIRLLTERAFRRVTRRGNALSRLNL
jgi:hypothetical protein